MYCTLECSDSDFYEKKEHADLVLAANFKYTFKEKAN